MISVSGFKSVIAVLDFFSSKEKCASYLEQQRWPNGVCCPNCGREYFLPADYDLLIFPACCDDCPGYADYPVYARKAVERLLGRKHAA